LKVVVVYQSASGFTEKYAQWISEALNADLFNVKKMSIETLQEYDTIVFGGNLHAVGISGVNTIKRNLKF